MSVWFRRALGLVAVLAAAWSSLSTATAGPAEDCSRLRAAAALAPCTLVIDDKAQTPEARMTALLMRARAELDLSELDKAEADIKAAFALRPTAFGYRLRGRLHGLRGQNAEARDDYLQAISLSESKSGRYVSYVDRGNFLVRIKDLPGALADFDLAIRLDPTKASAFVGRALTHKASGKIAEALADLNQAKAVEPSYWLTYVEQGDILVAERRFAEAVPAYDLALKYQPNDARALRGRAAATGALASNNPAPAPAPTARNSDRRTCSGAAVPRYGSRGATSKYNGATRTSAGSTVTSNRFAADARSSDRFDADARTTERSRRPCCQTGRGTAQQTQRSDRVAPEGQECRGACGL